jgi:Co/Zn/Cd efflux system component
MEEPSPDQAQPSPADQEAWQAGASARHAAAANLAEAIKRKKAAQKRKRTVILLIAGVGLVIVLISAWFLPSGPPDKSAAGLAEPKTGVPAAAQAPETTKFIADLASMDNAVRSSAAFALGERLDQAVYSAPALKQAMEKEQNAEVRTEMEKALKRLRSK